MIELCMHNVVTIINLLEEMVPSLLYNIMNETDSAKEEVKRSQQIGKVLSFILQDEWWALTLSWGTQVAGQAQSCSHCRNYHHNFKVSV